MSEHHDVAIGMLEGYVRAMSDPLCNPSAVKASSSTAILILRTLGIISAQEDSNYTESLRRDYERRQGRAT